MDLLLQAASMSGQTAESSQHDAKMEEQASSQPEQETDQITRGGDPTEAQMVMIDRLLAESSQPAAKMEEQASSRPEQETDQSTRGGDTGMEAQMDMIDRALAESTKFRKMMAKEDKTKALVAKLLNDGPTIHPKPSQCSRYACKNAPQDSSFCNRCNIAQV